MLRWTVLCLSDMLWVQLGTRCCNRMKPPHKLTISHLRRLNRYLLMHMAFAGHTAWRAPRASCAHQHRGREHMCSSEAIRPRCTRDHVSVSETSAMATRSECLCVATKPHGHQRPVSREPCHQGSRRSRLQGDHEQVQHAQERTHLQKSVDVGV